MRIELPTCPVCGNETKLGIAAEALAKIRCTECSWGGDIRPDGSVREDPVCPACARHTRGLTEYIGLCPGCTNDLDPDERERRRREGAERATAQEALDRIAEYLDGNAEARQAVRTLRDAMGQGRE